MNPVASPSTQLDKDSPVPLYHQLKSILLERVKQGLWKNNDQLPTEDALGAEFGVSKATVRQALHALAQAGVVRREQGRGTFVAEAKIQFGPRNLKSFTDEMHDLGTPAGSRVLDQRLVPASEEVALKLQVAPGAELFLLRRLRMAGGEPMGIQTVHIPGDLVPGIVDINFETASLYEALDSRFNLPPDHATQTHYAVAAGPEEAILLGVPEGSPALGGERLSFLRSGRPLELTYSIMRGDRYQIRLKLVRTHQ